MRVVSGIQSLRALGHAFRRFGQLMESDLRKSVVYENPFGKKVERSEMEAIGVIIGGMVADNAIQNIRESTSDYGSGGNVPFAPIKESTIKMRQWWVSKGSPGNVDGLPLNFTEDLANSIQFSGVTRGEILDVIIGVPMASPAAPYATIQELGGITGSKSAIPGKEIPPRPYLAPAVMKAWPKIKRIVMEKHVQANWRLAARFANITHPNLYKWPTTIMGVTEPL